MIRPLLISLLCGSLSAAESQQAPSHAELPMLQWSKKDQKALMNGTWWDKSPSLLPEPETTPSEQVPVEHLPIIVNDDDAAVVPSVPEETSYVHEYFLPDYLRNVRGLIDPQRLLSETETNDVQELINAIKTHYGINLYVSIFAGGQRVPPMVNAPAIARQIFNANERNLLLHFHVGDLSAMQIVLDPGLDARLGNNGRRDLLYQIKQEAARFDNPQDVLLTAMAALVQRTQADLNVPVTQPITVLQSSAPVVPEVDIEIEQEEAEEKHSFSQTLKMWIGQLSQHVVMITGVVIAIVILPVSYMFYRNKRTLRLLPSVPDKRLGAPHGAAQSATIIYRK